MWVIDLVIHSINFCVCVCVYTVMRDFSSEEESTILRMMQAVAVPILGNVCHVFMNGLNRVQV